MTRFLRLILRLLFGFRTFNEEVLQTKGPVLLLANHVSWWDWLLLGVCLDPDWRFVTSSTTAELTWIHRRIMVNHRTFPVDMNSPYAVKHIASYLHGGGRLVLFPEGRMSTTGSLMKLFEGTGFLAAKTHAKIITAFIRGASRLLLSPNSDRKEWFPRISVHFGPLLTPPHLEHVRLTEARSTFTTWLQDVMTRQQFETEMAHGPATIPGAILQRARKLRSRQILQDSSMSRLTYEKLWVGASILGNKWDRLLEGNSRVGVLLPNVNAFPVVLLSLWLNAKVPAILNYSAGPASLLACAQLSGLRQIITSRAFLERLDLDVHLLQTAGIELLFLEEVRTTISTWDRLSGLLRARWRPNPGPAISSNDPALVLFTSGSEGEPKAVELTHSNILSNIRQMLSVIDLRDSDRFFNALPLFHSFGLTVGLLLPLVQGTYVFLYLSPLHYRIIPSAFYNLNCTILFGTNTFLGAYGRKAHPYDFHNLRYVFAGAERLQPSTCTEWFNKFGVRILEGYGVTECSPCVSVNVPMHSRTGSAGRFLPGIEHRLEPVEGIEELQSPPSVQPSDTFPSHATLRCGRLLVRGPNLMRGYLNHDANRRFQQLAGWYDTGDIAGVDGDGFVFILGRLKRFAKISGEMVSLAAVEDALVGAFPHFGPKFSLAVLARPDAARGETLLAVTNEPQLTIAELREKAHAAGLNNLAIPKTILVVRDMPHLGSGKINYPELEKMVSHSNEQ